MIIRTTNILAGPLVLLVWAIDIYLFLACIRLVLGHLPGTQNSQFCNGLKLFTDPLVGIVRGQIIKRVPSDVPEWMPWTVVIVAGVIARHVLIWVIVSI